MDAKRRESVALHKPGRADPAMRTLRVIGKELAFPDPRSARGDGLVAIGGDLSVERLILAYRSGIFPWTADPITWWSPDPRAIFEWDTFHAPRSLERQLRKSRVRVTFDQDFRQTMEACAAPAPGRQETWISPEFIEAYTRLHELGHAHSVECWDGDDLAGGVYGVAIGGFFAGESMFHRRANASKIALYHLIQHLRSRGFLLFDIQMVTPVTRQLGAVTIPREEYLRRLSLAVQEPCSWSE
jgi:leucyl/phenylalanyl-tRNA---protein transferase